MVSTARGVSRIVRPAVPTQCGVTVSERDGRDEMGEMGSAGAGARRGLRLPRWTAQLASFGTAAALGLLMLPAPVVLASASTAVVRAAVDGRGDVDRRTSNVLPTAAQRQAVRA